ncbi:MAG: ATP-binding protein, partial [Bacteroidales bacterium]|nr:ATP-binding protein [Bacteroidales bacterium]
CKIIIENTQRMGQLIDDLLAFSRLSRTELKFTTIDTTDMVRKIFLDLTNEEMRERISFNVSPLCNSKGDITMIRQIWVNLISNSLKFSSSRERAVIDIECTKSGEMNEFFIRDNGVGFDMKYKDKLFGVFQRLHSSRDFEGTGVGLAIVQRVVHRHGGSVNAKGEVDKGAQFSFSLPAK